MPTDEQRMRREFEAWAEGVDLSPDFAAEREKCPDDPTHGWNYGKLTAWEAWQARDAEVQALREALTYALHVLECLKADNPNPLLPNARWRSVDMARAALSGEEGTDDE